MLLRFFLFVVIAVSGVCLYASQSATVMISAADLCYVNGDSSWPVEERYLDDVSSPEQIVAAALDVISGPAGQKRDWERFANLFAPNARLNVSFTSKGRADNFSMTPDQYIARFGTHLTTNGLFESSVNRQIKQFDHIAQVFEVFELRNDPDEDATQHGINAWQLMYYDNRWWIIDLMWVAVDVEMPIPTEFLLD